MIENEKYIAVRICINKTFLSVVANNTNLMPYEYTGFVCTTLISKKCNEL